ncbi:MAG: hypothetical protein K2O00_06970 [Muribaculaceae bacterium]|nr:hypothetical protein [Muribaculaceae bacterium]
MEGDQRVRILGNRIVPAGVIFTMNADPSSYEMMNYCATLGTTTANLQYVLGYAEQYNSYMTLQFKDYSAMNANMFDADARMYRHQTQFPIDEQNCHEMGKRLVAKATELNS